MSEHLFESVPEVAAMPNGESFAVWQHLDMLFSMSTECFYVIDLQQDSFCYVSPHVSFLSRYSVAETLRLGYGIFGKIAHPDDLPLLAEVYEAVLRYIGNASKEKIAEVDYFSCTFRLQWQHSFFPQPFLQAVRQQTKPVVRDGKVRYLLCSVVSSTTQKADSLQMYRKDGLSEAYDFRSKKWRPAPVEVLTGREIATLMLAKQGKSIKEIADAMNASLQTVRNRVAVLYAKLGVHSMQEAIIFATSHRMIFATRSCPKRQAAVVAPKRTRHLLTPEVLLRIQQGVNASLSVNAVAKKEAISEGAIRYAIKQGKVTKNS